MNIIKTLSDCNFSNNTVVAIGNFDGIHLGHQKIIKTVKEISSKTGFKSIIITFNPHPLKYFNVDLKLLITERKKAELISKYDIDYLIILEFNESIASMPPEIFVEEILLKKLNAKYVVLGYNYKFGRKRTGDIRLMSLLAKKHNFECVVIDKVVVNDMTVSSTNIRKLLTDGNIKLANAMLDRFYELEGKVCKGNNLGKLIGFPTANIEVYNEMLPKLGVYASLLNVEGILYPSVTCIGTKPTVSQNDKISVETHIIDFDEDIYDYFVELALVDYIREEEKFPDLKSLSNKIKSDRKKAIKILKSLTLI